jgi:hypothetical protein
VLARLAEVSPLPGGGAVATATADRVVLGAWRDDIVARWSKSP